MAVKSALPSAKNQSGTRTLFTIIRAPPTRNDVDNIPPIMMMILSFSLSLSLVRPLYYAQIIPQVVWEKNIMYSSLSLRGISRDLNNSCLVQQGCL